jgi:hypothetical protein
MTMGAATIPPFSIDSLESGTLDVDNFDHEAHVYLAWLFLEEFPLTDAIARFSSALQSLTAKLGVPGKYHATITWFFMLLIAERRETAASKGWLSFRRDNPDLFSAGQSIVGRYYSSDLLASDRARRTFVMPDRLVA